MITKDKTQLIQVLELDDFPSVAEELDAACDSKRAFLVFIDGDFYNSLRRALEQHPEQIVNIIEALASHNIASFTFEAQRRPLLIYKSVEKTKWTRKL